MDRPVGGWSGVLCSGVGVLELHAAVAARRIEHEVVVRGCDEHGALGRGEIDVAGSRGDARRNRQVCHLDARTLDAAAVVSDPQLCFDSGTDRFRERAA